MTNRDYTLAREVPHLGQEQAIEKAKELLSKEGFGVLTTIDVAATLKAKIGVDREPYVILGACNPKFANEALQIEPNIGVLLPCNVDVYQMQGKTIVETVNPHRLFQVVDNPKIAPIADEITARLQRVLEGL